MVILKVTLNYGDSDFQSLKSQLLQVVPELTEDWTDFNESDVSTVLLDLMLRLNEYSSYRRDKIARELLLPTARERKNVKALLAPTGYKMHSYISTSCQAEVKLKEAHSSNITVGAYTQFNIAVDEKEEPIKFSNLEDYTIYSGSDTIEMALTQGEVVTEEFTLSDIDNGRIYLSRDKIASNTIRVISRSTKSPLSEKVIFEELADIVQAPDAGYYFSHDQEDDASEFIDLSTNFESVISDKSVIEVKYLVSMGASGVLGSGKVVRIESPVYDESNIDVGSTLTIKNTTIASGGSDPEDIYTAKRNAQIYVKTMDTLVTLDDYENIISTHIGVKKCKALDWNYPISGIEEGFIVNIYIIPNDGYVVDDNYKNNLAEYIKERRMSGVKVNYIEAGHLDVNVGVTVYVRKNSLYKSRVKNSVTDRIVSLFEVDSVDFGTPIYYSELISQIQECDSEVVKVDLSGITGDIEPTLLQIPRLQSYEVQVKEL